MICSQYDPSTFDLVPNPRTSSSTHSSSLTQPSYAPSLLPTTTSSAPSLASVPQLPTLLPYAGPTTSSAPSLASVPQPSYAPTLQKQACSKKDTRFAAPKTDAELQQAQKLAVPKTTQKSTQWAVNIWKEWSAQRRDIAPLITRNWPPYLLIQNSSQLDYWLSMFVLEVRRRDGLPYPPNTLYSMCCGLMRYVRDLHPEVNFFKQPEFAGFRKSLDGEMKRLRQAGLGVTKKQAEPITSQEENSLWEKGLLGDHNPQVLLDTMVFYCGLYFALRSGTEHRSLQFQQIELVEPKDGKAYLKYVENFSKNNAGGLAHRKLQPKQVEHHANLSNPQRCFVRLYSEYVRRCPEDRKNDSFYLTPLKKPKMDIWYARTPVGHNTLRSTVSRLCEAGGITGFKTNHSLRVSSTTRLFQSGVDEQLIMKRTGHRSIEGVRTYKRVSSTQQIALSEVLNTATNCKDSEETEKMDLATVPKKKNVTPVPHSMNFSGCSSITINYNIQQ